MLLLFSVSVGNRVDFSGGLEIPRQENIWCLPAKFKLHETLTVCSGIKN